MNTPTRRQGMINPVYDWGRFTLVIDKQFGYNPIRVAFIRRPRQGRKGQPVRHTLSIPRRIHVRRFVNIIKRKALR